MCVRKRMRSNIDVSPLMRFVCARLGTPRRPHSPHAHPHVPPKTKKAKGTCICTKNRKLTRGGVLGAGWKEEASAVTLANTSAQALTHSRSRFTFALGIYGNSPFSAPPPGPRGAEKVLKKLHINQVNSATHLLYFRIARNSSALKQL